MRFKDLHPPILELVPGHTFYRVQLTRARKTSLRISDLLLPPNGLQTGRFSLRNEATAYLADSEHTALYESVFRRDVHSRSLEELARKSLVQFITKGRLRLADLRALAEPYPVLQAQRIAITQAFAQECRTQQLDGIVYASAQHPQHTCLVLFASGIAQVKKVASLPLVKPGTSQLLTSVIDAARRSGVPLVNASESD
jgi:hypothetical protein